MIKTVAKLFFASLFFAIFLAQPAHARDASQITDWYIKNLQSEFVLNHDSTLSITEKITADCGNLPNKHGIFRTVPTFYQKTASEKVKTPVDLVSITDFEGKSLKYSTVKSADSITWKIGDPNKTVTGENFYKITYKVHNAVRFDDPNFDELYWNLNGNFWEIPIDNFRATLPLPEQINKENSEINLYSGAFSQKDAGLANYTWNGKSLIVSSTKTLNPGEGITLSLTFPKDIVIKEPATLADKINLALMIALPILSFIFCFIIWKKYGSDPKLGRPEMVQYEPPAKLEPMELGAMLNNGYFSNNYLSAGIIKLAVDKAVKIEEIPKKGFLGQQDFKIIVLSREATLSPSEKELFDRLFDGKDEILLSSLQNEFYRDIPAISKKVVDGLIEKKYFVKSGFTLQIIFIVVAILTLGLGIFLLIVAQLAGVGLMLAGVIVLLFSFLMRRRTKEGAELLWEIEGFKLFMTQAEKYRQQFYEKEGMFDRYLPYAMVFGITGIWINNMKKIYGEAYFNTYHPYWFAGYALGTFNANSFEKSINSLSNSMVSTMASNPSSSGAGGGGFSGGGGGGGGGGGW